MIIYFSVAGGIAISVLLPLVRALLPKPPVAMGFETLWKRFRPYLVLERKAYKFNKNKSL